MEILKKKHEVTEEFDPVIHLVRKSSNEDYREEYEYNKDIGIITKASNQNLEDLDTASVCSSMINSERRENENFPAQLELMPNKPQKKESEQ